MMAFVLLSLSLVGCETTNKLGGDSGADVGAKKIFLERNRLVDELNHAIEGGDLAQANLIVTRLQNLRPNEPEALLARAEIALSQGNYNQAISGFEPLVTDASVSARAHQGLGLAFLLTGRSMEAKKHFDDAVTLDPKLWRAWNGLGHYNDIQRHWNESDKSYARAIKLKPDSAIIFNNRAFSHLMQSQYELAISDFRKALQYDPTLSIARNNLGIALAWRGRYEEALAGESHDNLPQAFNNVGYVAMLNGDYVVAEAYFVRAMEASFSFNNQAAANLRRLQIMKSRKSNNKN